jgi:hypothetical protein
MKKKGLVTIFGMVLALALIAAPAMAWDSSETVELSQHMQGDLLVYPVYAAGSGLQTKMHVVNSSDTNSVVAKVILRSHKYSQEVLDFLIYLSPNDYFDATISYLNGKYVLTSSDDSLVVGGVAASAAAPMTFTLATPCDGIVDSAAFGYIDVIEVLAIPTVNPGTGLWLPKMADGTVPKITITSPSFTGISNTYASWDGTYPGTVNSLSGFGEIDFVGADYAAYNATAFMNYENTGKVTVAKETLIGDAARNNLCEVEAALAKDDLVIPYYDSADAATLPIFTFPTKLAACPADWPLSTVAPFAPIPYAQGPYFDSPEGGSALNFNPVYGLSYYDKAEHTYSATCTTSPCPENPELSLNEEVNFVFLNSPFEAGWARAHFGDTTTCVDASTLDDVTFTGAPVIPLLVHFTADGFTLVPAAYTPGTIGYELD